MSLEIKTGTKEEWDAALPRPGESADIPSYYQGYLFAAQEASESLLCFQSIELTGRHSDDFVRITDIERTILGFLEEHSHPQTVRIICDSDENSRLYKVVYNYWFATDKPSRMEDDSWD